MRRRRQRQRGFSLVEVLASVTLFALVASATGLLATQSMRRTSENRHATAAVLLAQQELERLRGLDYPNLASGAYGATMGGQSFNVNTAIQANTPDPNMSQVVVTVTWTGPEGSRSYALRTILTDVTA
jgi:prepilin-type N-terminal cleavage/methylation domain-containing protein